MTRRQWQTVSMYSRHFGLAQAPFSIAPDPRYLYMSERHREALAHLLYGVGSGGGFVLLTGEIGAGKTTVCRCFLEQIPAHCNVAYIFNPRLTAEELLVSICAEFGLAPGCSAKASIQDCIEPLNRHLLQTHAQGQSNILIIDEAQALSAGVLEQLRLLTNLETGERKLLQIILIGQPELRDMLARPELEQLAQRIIARFHLEALSAAETAQYIRHRLAVSAGLAEAPGCVTALFSGGLMRHIHCLARGIPRRINLLCDRALLGAYTEGKSRVDRGIVNRAAREVFGNRLPHGAVASRFMRRDAMGIAASLALAVLAFLAALMLAPGLPGVFRSVASEPFAPVPPTALVDATVHADSRDGVPLLTEIATPWVDKNQAWRELALLWGLTLGQGDPCDLAMLQGVYCYQGRGNLAQIRQLDRPGILGVRGPDGEVRYAVLAGLSSDTASLRAATMAARISLLDLARLWGGEFATLWRAPAGYRGGVVGYGASGPEVDWLAARLAQLRGEAAPPAGQAFDKPLQDKLRWFQIAQGLAPDGRAGPLTFMRLNHAVTLGEPRLQSQPAPLSRQ